jgi:hypothetical protein
MLINAPRVLATGWDSFWLHWDQVGPRFEAGQAALGAMSVFQMIVLVLPAAGIAYSTSRVGHRAGRFGWRWSAGSARRRAGLLAGTAAALALAAFLLWPHGAYRPIQPYEKGTLLGGIRQLDDVPSGRPSLTLERQLELGGAPTERQLQREGHPRPLDGRSTDGPDWPATPYDGTQEPTDGSLEEQPTEPEAPTDQPAPAPTDAAPTASPETSTAPSTETTPADTTTDTTTTTTDPTTTDTTTTDPTTTDTTTTPASP